MCDKIYAYKEGESYQDLIDHSIGSLEVMERRGFQKYLGDSYFSVVARRLSDTLGERIELGNVKKIMRTLVLMHDIGKAEKSIQQMANKSTRLSFKYHEVFGAIYFYNLSAFDNLTEKLEANLILRKLAVLSVWNHLNALRNLDDSLRNFPIPNNRKIELREYGTKIVEEIRQRDIKDILPLDTPRDYDREDFEEMTRFSLIEGKDLREVSKLYSFFLSPIVISDSMNSCENRRDDKSDCCKKIFLKPFCGDE